MLKNAFVIVKYHTIFLINKTLVFRRIYILPIASTIRLRSRFIQFVFDSTIFNFSSNAALKSADSTDRLMRRIYNENATLRTTM